MLTQRVVADKQKPGNKL